MRSQFVPVLGTGQSMQRVIHLRRQQPQQTSLQLGGDGLQNLRAENVTVFARRFIRDTAQFGQGSPTGLLCRCTVDRSRAVPNLPGCSAISGLAVSASDRYTGFAALGFGCHATPDCLAPAVPRPFSFVL